jgi:hypothetical protein
MNPDGPRVPYVQSVGSLDVPPPYHFPGVTVNAFVWEAQMSAVQDYCDRFLNLGTPEERGFTYKPAPFWPYATLLFLDYPVMISSNPAPQDMGEVPYGDRGIVSQTEVLVSLPVVRYGLGADRLVTESELECALPFIVVGNPMSAVCGREMLGLGKLLAEIKTGEGRYPDSFLGTVDLPGWSEMRTGVEQQMLRFITRRDRPRPAQFPHFQPRPLARHPAAKPRGGLDDGRHGQPFEPCRQRFCRADPHHHAHGRAQAVSRRPRYRPRGLPGAGHLPLALFEPARFPLL